MRLIIFLLLVVSSHMIFAAPNSPPMPMLGGYRNANVTDAGVQAAADFAAQQINQGKLLQIVCAQSQVVAGVNYKMRLQIADPQGKPETYEVVVFVPLPVTQAPMQLTSAELVPSNPSPAPRNTP